MLVAGSDHISSTNLVPPASLVLASDGLGEFAPARDRLAYELWLLMPNVLVNKLMSCRPPWVDRSPVGASCVNPNRTSRVRAACRRALRDDAELSPRIIGFLELRRLPATPSHGLKAHTIGKASLCKAHIREQGGTFRAEACGPTG